MLGKTSIWRRLLNGWLTVAGRFGFVQTMLLLVLFYVVLIGAVGVVTALTGRDFLAKRGLGAEGSVWIEADTTEPDLERAKLQS